MLADIIKHSLIYIYGRPLFTVFLPREWYVSGADKAGGAEIFAGRQKAILLLEVFLALLFNKNS